MSKTKHEKIESHNKNRLITIGNMLREMRFSEGKNQDEFTEHHVSRRNIQHGEYGDNITLISLFNLIDCFGYRLDEFFDGME